MAKNINKNIDFTIIGLVGLSGVLFAAGILFYSHYGYSFIESMYNGRLAWPIFNKAISGQNHHSLNYYLQLADHLFSRVVCGYLLLVASAIVLVCLGRAIRQNRIDVPTAISFLGMYVSAFFLPPVFSRVFALYFLMPQDKLCLWALFFVILAISASLNFVRREMVGKVASLLLVVLCLLSMECTARFFVQFFPSTRYRLVKIAFRTYPELMEFRPHPFLQFTGAPMAGRPAEEVLAISQRFNNFGFIGRDFFYGKGKNVVRIACLGGSTTVSGYPAMMEKYLNTHKKEAAMRYEVLNFGLAGYTSANSVVNFVLNVRDFSPDYVVIHHGGNDWIHHHKKGPGFKYDYSHKLDPLLPPVIRDRYLIRASVIYRYLRFFNKPIPYDRTLKEREDTYPTGHEEVDIDPFRRNTKTIIDLAKIEGACVILTTSPYNNEGKWEAYNGPIKQNNTVIRELAREGGANVILVDMDNVLTGNTMLFYDQFHMKEEGKRQKAFLIGESILKHRQREDRRSVAVQPIIGG